MTSLENKASVLGAGIAAVVAFGARGEHRRRFGGPEVQGALGFLLATGAKSPLPKIDFASALGTLASGINNRGQIVGAYENPDAAPDRQPSPMPMPMVMRGMRPGL